jgi:hypothetical protein
LTEDHRPPLDPAAARTKNNPILIGDPGACKMAIRCSTFTWVSKHQQLDVRLALGAVPFRARGE